VILYLDASAAVKRYVAEQGSAEVRQVIATATVVGMVVLGRVEIAAALAEAVRTRALSAPEAEAVRQVFHAEWPDYVRLRVTETLASRADELAWQYGLRGYEAVHLAAALLWQDGIEAPVTLATFDRQLWQAGRQSGLAVFPAALVSGSAGC
jgi:predicted nucleic acid-binding protein